MDEPPTKRPRRDRDFETSSPRSPRHDTRDRNGYSTRRSDRDQPRDRKRRRTPSRSRSPPARTRSRDRKHNDRDRNYRHRTISRSRSPPMKRHRSRSRTNHDRERNRDRRNGDLDGSKIKDRDRGRDERDGDRRGRVKQQEVKMDLSGVDQDDPEAMMKAVMGFGGFRSTKNTKVPGNQWYGVRKEKKTEYRQYMNRVGGFNRPLSPSHG